MLRWDPLECPGARSSAQSEDTCASSATVAAINTPAAYRFRSGGNWPTSLTRMVVALRIETSRHNTPMKAGARASKDPRTHEHCLHRSGARCTDGESMASEIGQRAGITRDLGGHCETMQFPMKLGRGTA